MCIRDSVDVDQAILASFRVFAQLLGQAQQVVRVQRRRLLGQAADQIGVCLLYTSDAADERSSVDLGGRRIIKKKTDEIQKRGRCRQTKKTRKKDEEGGTTST